MEELQLIHWRSPDPDSKLCEPKLKQQLLRMRRSGKRGETLRMYKEQENLGQSETGGMVSGSGAA